MRKFISALQRLRADKSGSISILAAFVLVGVVGVSALALEYGHGLLQKAENQRVGRPRRLWRGARLRLDRARATSATSAASNIAALNGISSGVSPVGRQLADRRRQQRRRGHRDDQRPAAAGARADHQHDVAGQRHRLCRDQIRRPRLHHRAQRQRQRRDRIERRHQRNRRQLRRRLEQQPSPCPGAPRSSRKTSITPRRRHSVSRRRQHQPRRPGTRSIPTR